MAEQGQSKGSNNKRCEDEALNSLQKFPEEKAELEKQLHKLCALCQARRVSRTGTALDFVTCLPLPGQSRKAEEHKSFQLMGLHSSRNLAL
ncbi:hypothetical protein AV530_012078 [Patagioenas fasciata monilis]|uniref:Uncharacterized protein n=1 Tax=Patagioenas fasciata monilis TaxID=372326 RepID=A0A1V4JUS5_PATFA|nr:hypothetical protein AV530_012078 [Patagioenas fasciata monilis]